MEPFEVFMSKSPVNADCFPGTVLYYTKCVTLVNVQLFLWRVTEETFTPYFIEVR